jgi:hypothetical protein
MQKIIFATSRQDALAKCAELGVQFVDVIWVMNLQLLGAMDISEAQLFVTEGFIQTPAYAEVAPLL